MIYDATTLLFLVYVAVLLNAKTQTHSLTKILARYFINFYRSDIVF
ncbi:hypothetical protein CAMRE0001_1380 [Campylobacter rectus RM3267]|uniref:Uncharacterized protein n=1 Tax=Campylobacter rectus RM3267 TaxID=553218 RepID=B9D065_CAMRE|nr:hypothetical protein CAMRE0001_1380 [Campylobacter rectus RM3267]